MSLKHDARSSSSKRASTTASGRGVVRPRRGLMVLTVLAGAAAVTTVGLRSSVLWGQAVRAPVFAAAQQPQMSNADRYAKGVDEYRKAQYEEAVADLQQVSAESLSAQNRNELADVLKRSEAAATERKAARAEFELGEQALSGNRLPEASARYRAAMNNRFADDGTKAKSKEQLAVVDAMMKQTGQSQKGMYDEAIADLRANNLDVARSKFDQLDKAGFRAGLFQKSPGDYVKEIDKRIGSAPPAPVQLAQPANTAPPAPVMPAPLTPEPVVAPVVQAPPPPPAPVMPPPLPPEPVIAPVVQAPPPPAPVFSQPAPTPTPAPVFVPPPAPVATQPPPVPETPIVQPAPAMVDPSLPVVTPTPQPAAVYTPAAPVADARTAYRTAKDQYNKGDWISARANFVVARDNGYKPGLFEDSPERYLSKMDDKERRDAEMAASQARAAGQDAGAAAQADQNRSMSQQLVQQAEAARAANRLDEALALYMRAADLDPANVSAANGRNALAQTLQLKTGRPDLLTEQQTRNDQQRAYINYSFQTAISQAKDLIGKQSYQEAQSQIERARVARNINPGVFTDQELRAFDTTVTQTQLEKDRAVEGKRLADADASRVDGEAQVREQERLRAEQRVRTVADLTRESRRLTDEGNYQEALGVLDQILTLDPNNDYAQGVRPLVYDRAIILEQRKYRERYDRNVTRWYTIAEEEKIPYSDILKYPDNWPDLSATRDRTAAREQGDRTEDQAVYAQLDRKLPEVRLDNVAFVDAVEFLRDVSGTNLQVNWRALETAGVDRNAQVSVPRIRDVKFSKILKTILDDVGGGTVKLNYTIDEGLITISTEEDLSGPNHVTTRVYDIRDLIINVEDFDQPPQFNIQSAAAGRGGGGGQNLFAAANNANNANGTRQILVDQMIALIQETVANESWKAVSGSGPGTIRNLPGSAQLIVTQTPENQLKLRELLNQLRETRAIQITIETRFLTVQRNFLEEVGVDFDFLLPSGQLFSNVGPIGVSNNSQAYTGIGNLQTAIPGNIATDLAAASSGSAGITPNLGINNGSGGAITFLDDFQVSLLLRATQISQNTTTLTAPRLTLFNGQRAFVVVSTATAYVSDVTPVIATGAVAFDPTITNAQSGVLLDVQATVSSDRKYVTLTLRPTLSRLRTFVTFPVSAVVNVAAGAAGGTNTTQITSANIQQPIIDNTIINTTVSVPDGGTLLLGGQTLAGEIERESGVPILSKIPFLKRLFTNSSMAKDEQILLILVKPTIIIQREKEQEQFPLLNSAR